MKNFTKLFLCLLLLGAAQQAKSQTYSVTMSNASYSELMMPTVLTGSETTLKQYYTADIPGSFKLGATNYACDKMSTMGMGTTITSDGAVMLAEAMGGSTIGVIDAFSNCTMVKKDASSTISYVNEGDAKTGILKIQWKNMGLSGSASADVVNVQLWLHRTDNSVSIHMGPSTVTGMAAFGDHMGMQGPRVGWERINGNGAILSSAFLKGSASAPSVMTNATKGNEPYLSSVPANNSGFMLQPKAVAGIDNGSADISGLTVYPNPANDACTVAYNGAGAAQISIVDLTGKEVIKLINEDHAAGVHQVAVDTRTLKTGIYIYQVQQNGTIASGKIVISK